MVDEDQAAAEGRKLIQMSASLVASVFGDALL